MAIRRPRLSCCRWSTMNCAASPPRTWRRSRPGKRCNRPPWSTKPTCGWWARRTNRTGTAPAADDQLLALNEALEQLAAEDPVAARVVDLRRFAGLSHEQVAATLHITV